MKNSVLAFAAVAGAFLSASVPAAAQCAMCYISAAGSGGKGIHALKVGILVLGIPTVAIFSGLLWVAFRYRNSYPSWPSPARGGRELLDPPDGLIPLPALEGDGVSPRM